MVLKEYLLLLGVLFLVGCTAQIDTRGFETDHVAFSKIKTGDTPEHVSKLVGSPSTTSAFPPTVWYYVSKVTHKKAFLSPEVLEQIIVAVEFDSNARVTHVREIQGEEIQGITHSRDITPTAGYESGLLREVFSNFGKIATNSGGRR